MKVSSISKELKSLKSENSNTLSINSSTNSYHSIFPILSSGIIGICIGILTILFTKRK